MDVRLLDALGELASARQDRGEQHPGAGEVAAQLYAGRLDVAHEVLDGLPCAEVVGADEEHDLVGVRRDDLVESGEQVVARVTSAPKVADVEIGEPVGP